MDEINLSKVRNQRDQMLAQSDWVMLPDSPFTEAQKQLWATYRQQLRDLTKNIGNVKEWFDVDFPVRPE